MAFFGPKVLRQGHAMRVIFYSSVDECSYIDQAQVTLWSNGIVHIKAKNEETTTHLQNCEILWRFETDEKGEKTNILQLRDANRDSANRELNRAKEGGLEGKDEFET